MVVAMQHDWYQTKGLGAWWIGSIAFGGTFALGGSAFVQVWETVLTVGAGALCVSAPFVGVWTTRLVQRQVAAAKQRTRNLRGERYADYAYVL